MDIHSFSRPDQARVRHLDLDLDLRFDRRILEGSCTLHFDRVVSDELILDTRDLTIHSVEHAAGFELGAADPVLGAPLKIRVAPGTDRVRVHYSTSPVASGLQWLDPPQTADKRHPFLYTQSEAIHARSWIPLQDTPGVRVTYTATVHTPPGLKAVMGAEMHDNARQHLPHGPADSLVPDRAGRGRPGVPSPRSALGRLCRAIRRGRRRP
ncbi:hypothetical protein SBA4_3000015 [Candidatus Sulfopaludibacter sp. SbA4]|nr:hypothetical protein SBA4_3000015 [Candidatus Sulfopaludibacter sp. SbA4]